MNDIVNENQNSNDQTQMQKAIPLRDIGTDPLFRSALKVKMNQAYSSAPIGFGHHFWGASKVLLTGVGTALLLFVLIGTVGYQFFKPNDTALSAEKQKEVLANIAKSNANGLLTNTSPQEYGREVVRDAAAVTDRVSAPMLWQGADNNLNSTKSTFRYGPAATRCYFVGDDPYSQTTTKSTYYYGGDVSYSMMEIYDINDNLLEYSLWNGETNIYYRGGEYAVQIKYSAMSNGLEVSVSPVPTELSLQEVEKAPEGPNSTMPDELYITPELLTLTPTPEIYVEPEPTPYDPIAAMFGGATDLKISRVIGEDGKDYYLVSYTNRYMCGSGEENDAASLNRTKSMLAVERSLVVEQAWVDMNTYEIVKSQSYLGSISPDNLIQTNTFIQVNQNITPQEVANIFVFPYNAPIKTYEMPEYLTYGSAEYFAKLRVVLESQGVSILLAANSDLMPQWLNVPDIDSPIAEANNYQADRAFYPAGGLGDKLFAYYNGQISDVPQNRPVLVLGYGSNEMATDLPREGVPANWYGDAFSIQVYSSSDNDLELLQAYYYDEEILARVKSQSATTATISGSLVETVTYNIKSADNVVTKYTQEGNPEGTPMAEESTVVEEMPPICTFADCAISNQAVIFTYGGFKYLVDVTSLADSEMNPAALLHFSAYNSGDASELDQLIGLFQEMDFFLPVYSEEDLGQSESGSGAAKGE